MPLCFCCSLLKHCAHFVSHRHCIVFQWKSITNLVEFLTALAELALFGEFYVHAFDPSNTAAMNYYRFQLSWPWLGIAYVPVTI